MKRSHKLAAGLIASLGLGLGLAAAGVYARPGGMEEGMGPGMMHGKGHGGMTGGPMGGRMAGCMPHDAAFLTDMCAQHDTKRKSDNIAGSKIGRTLVRPEGVSHKDVTNQA